METNDIKSVIKWALSLLLLVFLFLFFNWWGIIGYFIFIFLLATYILYTRRKTYKLIVKYGSDSLHKIGGTKENEHKLTKHKNIKKTNS